MRSKNRFMKENGHVKFALFFKTKVIISIIENRSTIIHSFNLNFATKTISRLLHFDVLIWTAMLALGNTLPTSSTSRPINKVEIIICLLCLKQTINNKSTMSGRLQSCENKNSSYKMSNC